jgi:hypothetical protein
MSVVIHEPEIEALIEQRMATGAFQSVEAVLLHALKSAPVPSAEKRPKQNLADFLMESPLRGSGIELERIKDYPVLAEVRVPNPDTLAATQAGDRGEVFTALGASDMMAQLNSN